MENEKLDLQVGDRITYKHDVMEIETIEVIYDLARISTLLFEIEEGHIKILKIERPKYEVVEEKKELLTEEEKEFLKDIIKYFDDIKNIYFNVIDIGFYNKNGNSIAILDYPKNIKFAEIERNKYYTLKELGLEE